MSISKPALEAYLKRPLDSLVWIKSLSLDQLMDEIGQFKTVPHFKTEPWQHQAATFLLGMMYPQLLMLLSMGLGKSKILTDLINQRIREKKITRALITVPRLINLGSWQDDMAKHSGLEPNICIGDIEHKWELLSNPKGDVTLIDYAGLHLAVCRKLGKKLVRDDGKIAQLQKLYQFVALDESHLCRNKETLRFGILRQLTKTAAYSYATTGTLFGRDVEAIWAQFYLVDRGQTFGETLGLFRAGYMREEQDYWAGSKWVFDKKKARSLYRALQHRSIRYDETECADLPECQHITIKCPMTSEQQDHYNRALDGIIQAGGNPSATEAQWLTMRRIVAGYLIWEDEYGNHEVRFNENPKLDAIENLLESSGERRVIISHEYTATGKMISDRLTKLGYKHEWLYGGSKDSVNSIRRFKTDPTIKVFLMNSVSGGTGVDGLQDTATYLIFAESPCSPITRKQTEKRIHRPGQLHKTFIYDLVGGSVDYTILAGIKEGRDMHDAVVGGQFPTELKNRKFL